MARYAMSSCPKSAANGSCTACLPACPQLVPPASAAAWSLQPPRRGVQRLKKGVENGQELGVELENGYVSYMAIRSLRFGSSFASARPDCGWSCVDERIQGVKLRYHGCLRSQGFFDSPHIVFLYKSLNCSTDWSLSISTNVGFNPMLQCQ
jgi:hypothetical protein